MRVHHNYQLGDRVKILSSSATGVIKTIKRTIVVVSLDVFFIEKGKSIAVADVKSKIVKFSNLESF